MNSDHRRVVRTVFQTVISVAAGMPLFVEAAGLPEKSAVVAGMVAVSGSVTRLMALPQVEALLPSWLRKEPPDDGGPGGDS